MPKTPRDNTPPRTESATARRPVLDVLTEEDYRLLWTAGWAWHSCRWIWVIIAGYLVLQLTGSTFQTQLVGVAWSTPMLILGVFSGLIADSFDRRRILIAIHVLNLVFALAMVILILTGLIQAWHILALTGCIGLSNTLDMAARRTFVSDLVNRSNLPFALALESMSMTGAMMIGPWVGGALVDFVPLGTAGAGSSYLIVIFLYLISLVQLRRTTPAKYPANTTFSPFTALANTWEGMQDIAKNRAAIGALGVTVLVNLFFFSYTPLIPVFAQNVLEVNATLMGILGGAQGAGALMGSMFIASRKHIGRNSNYYVYGSIFAFINLLIFSFSRSFPLSVLSLMMAGFGIAGFSTMQATIILLSVKDEIRGRAMGMVNMAIGALPIGMLIVGVLAETLGPIQSTNLSASFGLLTLGIWAWRSKAMRQI